MQETLSIQPSAAPGENAKSFTCAQLAELLDLPIRTIQWRCKNDKYKTEKNIIDNQVYTVIPFSSLPPGEQRTCSDKLISSARNLSEYEADAMIYSKAKGYARRFADRYIKVLDASTGLTGKALFSFVDNWNRANPAEKTSYSSIMNARKRFAIEGISGLMCRWGNREGASDVTDEQFQVFHDFWMREGAPSLKTCWKMTLGHFSLQSKESFPSPAAFAHRMKCVPEQSQYLARFGADAHNRKYASYINRNYDNVRCGQVWVSDHHQLDVCCMDPRTGRPCFPWVTVWMDFKSTKWLGWLLHCESPNSDHIFQSFHTSVSEWGLCDSIIIDNGKDYRCRDFAGHHHRIKVKVGDGESQKQVTALGLLKIKVHFALPYSAQSKSLERSFGTLIDLFCKHSIGYRGSNTKERPEKLEDEIKSGAIMKFDDLSKLFDSFIKDCLNKNSSQGKNHLGKSPDQLWAEEFTTKREVSKEALSLFCMRTSGIQTISRNGFHDSELGVNFWGEWMSGCKGAKVFARRDIKNYATALIFNARTDELMGVGRMEAFSAPALASTEVDHADLKAALTVKNHDLRIARAFAKTNVAADPIMDLRDLKSGILKVSGESPEASPKIHHMPSGPMEEIIKQRKKMETVDDELEYPVPAAGEKKTYFDSEADRDSYYSDTVKIV